MADKHTPGPWYYAPAAKSGYWIEIDDELIAKVVRNGDVELANARLIATAPELLQALKQCYSDLSRYAPNSTGSIEARAVITKAEGK